MKMCPDCGQAKPRVEFTRDRSRTDGLAFYRRECARRRHRNSKEVRCGPPKCRYPRDIEVPSGHKGCPDALP